MSRPRFGKKHPGCGKPGDVFVSCIDCGREASKRVDDPCCVSDTEATKHFRSLGWTVKPTRCPECRKVTPVAK